MAEVLRDFVEGVGYGRSNIARFERDDIPCVAINIMDLDFASDRELSTEFGYIDLTKFGLDMKIVDAAWFECIRPGVCGYYEA